MEEWSEKFAAEHICWQNNYKLMEAYKLQIKMVYTFLNYALKILFKIKESNILQIFFCSLVL